MYGDFSRNSFDPCKQYTRVLLQQGRPLTDADWNEQVSILARREWNLIRSLLRNNHGTFDGGFLPKAGSNNDTFTICPGSYYVNGLRCLLCPERDPSVNLLERVNAVLKTIGDPQNWLLYLDAWEQTVTAFEDQALLEPSLNGNDTALRGAVHWAIRIKPIDGPPAAAADAAADATAPTNDPSPPCPRTAIQGCDSTSSSICTSSSPPRCIRVRRRPAGSQPKDPCEMMGQSGDSVFEEALYRIEVHQAGRPYKLEPGNALPDKLDDFMTFKWSRENGAAVVAIRETNPSSVVTVDSRWPKSHQPFATGHYVELFDQRGRFVNAERRLASVKTPGRNSLTLDPPLHVVQEEDPDVVLSSEPFADIGPLKQRPVKSLFLRRWDQTGAVLPNPLPPGSPAGTSPPDRDGVVTRQSNDGKLTLTTAGVALAVAGPADKHLWLKLERGIQVCFDPADCYSVGDYWLIRTTATFAEGFWPPLSVDVAAKNQEGHKVPQAGGHSYAPLAKLTKPLVAIDSARRCWNGRVVKEDTEPTCRPIPEVAPAGGAPAPAAAPAAPAPPQPTPPPGCGQCARPESVRDSILSAVGRVALNRFLTSPDNVTRRVPARYLNYEPQSDAYRRFRSPLLVSEILESSYEKYLAKVERCIDVSEAERERVEADARADYALAAEFQSLVSSGQGFRPLIA